MTKLRTPRLKLHINFGVLMEVRYWWSYHTRSVADPDLERRGDLGFCCLSSLCDSLFLPKIRGSPGPPGPSPWSTTVDRPLTAFCMAECDEVLMEVRYWWSYHTRSVADPDLERRGDLGFCCLSSLCDSLFLPKIRGSPGPPGPSPWSTTVDRPLTAFCMAECDEVLCVQSYSALLNVW